MDAVLHIDFYFEVKLRQVMLDVVSLSLPCLGNREISILSVLCIKMVSINESAIDKWVGLGGTYRQVGLANTTVIMVNEV